MLPMLRRGRAAPANIVVIAATFTFTCSASLAGASRYCDTQVPLSASQQSKLLRFSEVVKAELAASGQSVALLSRSGLDLARFGIRYSHAGISLKSSPNTPWSIRQLYYACDEQKPRIFDQGMAGFVLGTDSADLGYVSAVLMPTETAKKVEAAALSNPQALALLHPHYSANAYAYSLRFQNCNQWVIELLASAFGAMGLGDARTLADDLAAAPDILQSPLPSRANAQSWLRQQGYLPSSVQVGSRLLMWAGAFIPHIHSDDHPEADLAQQRYQVSMPASIESFVQTQVPGAQRIEFCYNAQHIVIHRGWAPVQEGCVPGSQDQVIAFD
jgi:hypothetical protein